MTDERIALNLDNMRSAARDAVSFLSEVTKEEFLTDDKTQKACAMCLIIIGEATSKIEKRAPDFVADHHAWPWDKIRGIRNRIVHDYFNLDLMTIWLTVKEHLPQLLRDIDALGELDPRLASDDVQSSS